MSRYYYCPICGKTTFPNQSICPSCKNYIQPCESIHDSSYYIEKAMKIVGNPSYARQILIDEEASQNPQFNPNTTTHNAQAEYDERINKIFHPKQAANPNVPKCPTCGSTNIEKISNLRRGAHAAAFGLISKTARSQFGCKNCGYKW